MTVPDFGGSPNGGNSRQSFVVPLKYMKHGSPLCGDHKRRAVRCYTALSCGFSHGISHVFSSKPLVTECSPVLDREGAPRLPLCPLHARHQREEGPEGRWSLECCGLRVGSRSCSELSRAELRCWDEVQAHEFAAMTAHWPWRGGGCYPSDGQRSAGLGRSVISVTLARISSPPCLDVAPRKAST